MAGLKISFSKFVFDRVPQPPALKWVQKAPLLTFDIPQTTLVATLDTYDLLIIYGTYRAARVKL
jgi:hypothetical protein